MLVMQYSLTLAPITGPAPQASPGFACYVLEVAVLVVALYAGVMIFPLSLVRHI